MASYQPSCLLSSPFSTLNPKNSTSFRNRSGHITPFFNLFNYCPLSTAPWLNTTTYPLVLRAQVCSGPGICSTQGPFLCSGFVLPSPPGSYCAPAPSFSGKPPDHPTRLSLLHHLLSWTPCLSLAAFIPQFASLVEILWEYSFPLLLFLKRTRKTVCA